MNQRTFICGSEWLYIKIYSGPKTIENIFIYKIYPLLNNLIQNSIIDRFFFIRYTDPHYHIRLRLHFENTDYIGCVLKHFNQLLYEYISNYLISSVIIDIYNREIERYRDRYIIDVEWLFFYDSKFILDHIYTHPDSEQEKWLIPIKYIDSLFNRCGLLLTDKMDLCNQVYEVMSVEVGTKNKITNEQLKLKYRNNSKIIKEVINDNNGEKYSWINNLNSYLSNIESFTQKLKNDNHLDIFDILKSIVHMHINRLFRTKQRINECVIYYLLFKFYNSMHCLSKKNINVML
jgi:thiopeptide-type bacteriocin biosynthesis protein